MSILKIGFLPNLLSMLRLLLGSIFAYMLSSKLSGNPMDIGWYYALYMMIVLSDLLDGRLARKLGCTSRIGAVLDVVADSYFILISCVILNYYQVFPVWFTAVIVMKLVDFIVSSILFTDDKERVFLFDSFGRVTAAGFYLMPILAVLLSNQVSINCAIYALMVLAMISTVLRWIIMLCRVDRNRNLGIGREQ